MPTPEEKVITSRIRHWKGLATDTVVNFLAYNQLYSPEDKQKILRLAQGIADSQGRIRVTLQDFQLALRRLREKGEIK